MADFANSGLLFGSEVT